MAEAFALHLHERAAHSDACPDGVGHPSEVSAARAVEAQRKAVPPASIVVASHAPIAVEKATQNIKEMFRRRTEHTKGQTLARHHANVLEPAGESDATEADFVGRPKPSPLTPLPAPDFRGQAEAPSEGLNELAVLRGETHVRVAVAANRDAAVRREKADRVREVTTPGYFSDLDSWTAPPVA